MSTTARERTTSRSGDTRLTTTETSGGGSRGDSIRPTPAPRPIGVVALIGAVYAASLGFALIVIPVLIGWAFASYSNATTTSCLRLAAVIWLAAHHVPLAEGGATITLLPLGLMLVPGLILWRVGRWAARVAQPKSLADATLLTVTLAFAYGVIGALVAGTTPPLGVKAEPPIALICCGFVAAVSAGWPILRSTGQVGRVISPITPWWRGVIRAGIVGALILVAGGALLAAVSLSLNISEAADLTRGLGTGVVGLILLTLLCASYVPNIAIWATGFAVGPGFATGQGTAISYFVSDPGSVPAVPLLAGLPRAGTPPAVALIGLVIPLVAGVFVGLLASRRTRPVTVVDSLAAGAAGGVVAGVVCGLLVLAASGSMGHARWSAVGASAWQVGGLAALELATVAAFTAYCARRDSLARWLLAPVIAKLRRS
jgi:Family of unknown function (DUF6350)